MRALAGLMSGLFIAATLAGALIVFSAHLSVSHWLLDLAGQFQLPALWGLMASAAGLLILLAFKRDRFANILFALIAAVFAGTGWYGIWPAEPGARPAGAQAITVYQHNVWANHPDPERVVDGLLASNADIAALVEVRDDVYAPFATTLEERWPHQIQRSLDQYGYPRLRLLSRYEVLQADVREPANSPAMLQARLRLPEGELTVLIVHFTRPWPFDTPEAQLRQLAGLADHVNEINGPLVVLGDVNSVPWGRLAVPLERKYGFSLVNDPRVGTWPARAPIKFDVPSIDWPPQLAIPIDLAFCRGSLVCLDHTIGPHHGSDHRSATFALTLDKARPD
jgi:endonuclease/exonuclease/phosphatase (EEP) superfamily protein YafD